MLARASICSVTRMVPNSAAIAPPTRPASIVAASTGPKLADQRHIDCRPQLRFHVQVAELVVALLDQHHADERSGQRDDRQAQDPDLVEARQQGFFPGNPRQQPPRGPQRKDRHVSQADQPVDDYPPKITDPVDHGTRETRGEGVVVFQGNIRAGGHVRISVAGVAAKVARPTVWRLVATRCAACALSLSYFVASTVPLEPRLPIITMG